MDQDSRDEYRRNLHTVNQWLLDEYQGPFGPRYWLLVVDDVVVVRGWSVGRNGKPMGEHLAVCRTMAEALAWVETHKHQ